MGGPWPINAAITAEGLATRDYPVPNPSGAEAIVSDR